MTESYDPLEPKMEIDVWDERRMRVPGTWMIEPGQVPPEELYGEAGHGSPATEGGGSVTSAKNLRHPSK